MGETPVAQWLRFAERDLEEARLLQEHDFYRDKIGFCLQQTVEKLLKALIAKVPRLHDLVVLVEETGRLIDTKEFKALFFKLNKYYIAPRYPAPVPIVKSVSPE